MLWTTAPPPPGVCRRSRIYDGFSKERHVLVIGCGTNGKKNLCPVCIIPEWKMEKYNATHFRRRHGSFLTGNSDTKMTDVFSDNMNITVRLRKLQRCLTLDHNVL